jgi:hypothetical protein
MYGYGSAYGFYARLMAAIEPCLENLTFWQEGYNAEFTAVTDQSEADNDAPLIANTKYFDGTASIVIEDEGNFVYAIDTVAINRSTDNTTFNLIESNNDSENTLFIKDIDNKRITIGNDGTNDFTGWISNISLINDSGGEFLLITNSSGIDDEEYNVLTSMEQYWVNQQFPFGMLDGDMSINGDLNVTGGI